MLQYLNSKNEVDPQLATLSIDLEADGSNYPHTAVEIKRIIDQLKRFNPKHIILMMEHLDFAQSIEEKKNLYDILLKNNVYLNGNEARDDKNLFENEEVFKNYPHFITFYRTKDGEYKESRRALLQINAQPPSELFRQLEKMGLRPKPNRYFTYQFEYQNSQQAYIKSFPLGTYGNYHSKDLLAARLTEENFKNKTVIIGTNDHFSWLNGKSVFAIGKTKLSPDYMAALVPLQDVFANIVNFYTTGNYIKFIQKFDDLLVICLILFAAVLVNFSAGKKLFLFYSLIPIVYLIMITIYLVGSFYIDWSRSIVLLAILQYLATPIILFISFKRQEQQKLLAINDARIDALLTISEKVAHDIRSPISTVNLLITKAKFENEEHRTLIYSSIERINRIIESILSSYKGTEFAKINLEKVDIGLIVANTIQEKTVLAPTASFVRNFEPSAHFADGVRIDLERVISNIVDNSIQAFREDKQKLIIRFDLNTREHFTDLVISDNGTGIPENILNLIGHQRVSSKAKGLGSGIGLLHAKRAINHLGGTLTVHSGPTGTSITISLKTTQNDPK